MKEVAVDGGEPKKPKRDQNGSKLLSLQTGAKASKAEKQRLGRYSRGEGNRAKGVTKHRLKLGIKRGEKKISAAAMRAAQAEILAPTEAGVLEA